MPPFVRFAIGLAARTLGLVAEHFAQWLFHQISSGAEYGLDLLDEVRQFGQAFVRMIAGQFCGRRTSRRHEEYGDEWEPGLYPD